MAIFENAIGTILKHEGGLSDVSGDAGGLTKYGISSAQYPEVDIRNLTLNEAMAIYKRDYWNQNLLGEINNQHIATMAFDMLVHHGQGARLLQNAANDSGANIEPDNSMGPITIKAINKVEPALFVTNAIKRRVNYMKDLVRRNPVNKKFLAGWLKRAQSFSYKLAGSGEYIIAGVIAYFIWPKGKKK